MTKTEEKALVIRAKLGDKNAVHSLVANNSRLVRLLTRKLRKAKPWLADDITQQGFVGLLYAIEKFDVETPVKFMTYARWWVLHFAGSYVGTNSHAVANGQSRNFRKASNNYSQARSKLEFALQREATAAEIAKEVGVPEKDIESVIAFHKSASIGISDNYSSDDPLPDEKVSRLELMQKIHSILPTLSPKEQEVIRHCYLGPEENNMTEVGKMMGLTKERIRQIRNSAVEKLRGELGACSDWN